MTLAGLSRVNVENVLAVTSATLALGFTYAQVADGLRSFSPGEDNPGRMNVWSLPREGSDPVSVVIDLAHNEAGLEALLEIMNGIRPPGGRLLLGVGSAGDRSDEVFVRLGEMAAVGADVVEIAHKTEYLRGRTTDAVGRLIMAGAAHAGVDRLPEHQTEVGCLVSLISQSLGERNVATRSGARVRPQINRLRRVPLSAASSAMDIAWAIGIAIARSEVTTAASRSRPLRIACTIRSRSASSSSRTSTTLSISARRSPSFSVGLPGGSFEERRTSENGASATSRPSSEPRTRASRPPPEDDTGCSQGPR